eukprot:1194160-Prorocentrum_minimum.AAC.3
MVTVICNGHVDSEWKIMRNSFEPSLKHTTSHTSGDVQQRFSNRWTEVRDDPIECAKRAGRRLVYAYFVLHLRLHLRDTAFKLSLGPCLLPGGDSCAWNYPSASFIRHENIPALPACDWSTMRIYPRFLSLIGTILRGKSVAATHEEFAPRDFASRCDCSGRCESQGLFSRWTNRTQEVWDILTMNQSAAGSPGDPGRSAWGDSQTTRRAQAG